MQELLYEINGWKDKEVINQNVRMPLIKNR